MSEFELSGLLSMDASSMVGGLEDATDASGELADETEELSDGVDETTDNRSVVLV